MSTVDLKQYKPDYINYLENSELKGNTVEKRKLMVENFIEDHEDKKLVLDTEEFYDSVDQLREYFEQDDVKVYGTRVSAIRDFIDFVKTQVDSRTEDQLDDIKEKIKLSNLSNKDESVGRLEKEDIDDKLLSDEEIEAAKECASDKTCLIIDLMLDTAARPGEIVAMCPEDVDFDNGSFYINSTWSDAEGRVVDSPKHDSYRRVKISDGVLERLREYVDDCGIGESEQVFASYRSDVYNPLKKAFTEADVKVVDGSTTFTPHHLRHNACTRLIQNGNRKEKVQEYMGHKSVQITEVYEHFDDSNVVDVELV
jgi:integrase